MRLGQAERAHTMLRFFFNDRRPPGWNQWAEVVLPKVREARFLGDMPHAWVSSDYIRSALDLMAYERETDATLVLGAGLQPEWRAHGDVEVRGLSTPYGRLDYRLRRGTRLIASGLSAGFAEDVDLTMLREYVHPRSSRALAPGGLLPGAVQAAAP